MSHVVCGDRSFLSWHMQKLAAQEGLIIHVVDPHEFIQHIPTEEDVELILDEPTDEGDIPHVDDTDLDIAVPADDGLAEEQALFPVDYLTFLADARLWWPRAEAEQPTDEELAEEIRNATQAVLQILATLPSAPQNVVLATSINAGNGTAVGQALAEASVLLSDATADYTTRFVEIQFPHLFGELCPPHRSSLVSNLAQAIARGRMPRVSQDRPMTLMYAHEAARVLLSDMPDFAISVAESTKESTAALAEQMNMLASVAETGALPAHLLQVPHSLTLPLYATLRAFQVAQQDEAVNLPTLPSPAVLNDMARVTSRVYTVDPSTPLTLQASLRGLHRLAVVAGKATIELDAGVAAYAEAGAGATGRAAGSLVTPGATCEASPAMTDEAVTPAFIDLPHGYMVTITALEGPCVVGEWVSDS